MAAQLIPITCEPPGKGIEAPIEELREAHAEGILSSLAIAVVYRDGCTHYAHSPLPSRATMIGAVARLQHSLLEGG